MLLSPTGRLAASRVVLVIDQYAKGSAIGIVKLAVFDRPKKAYEAQKPETQRNRDEQSQPCHLAAFLRRSALATTTSDEPDIAAAAINGVT